MPDQRGRSAGRRHLVLLSSTVVDPPVVEPPPQVRTQRGGRARRGRRSQPRLGRPEWGKSQRGRRKAGGWGTARVRARAPPPRSRQVREVRRDWCGGKRAKRWGGGGGGVGWTCATTTAGGHRSQARRSGGGVALLAQRCRKTRPVVEVHPLERAVPGRAGEGAGARRETVRGCLSPAGAVPRSIAGDRERAHIYLPPSPSPPRPPPAPPYASAREIGGAKNSTPPLPRGDYRLVTPAAGGATLTKPVGRSPAARGQPVPVQEAVPSGRAVPHWIALAASSATRGGPGARRGCTATNDAAESRGGAQTGRAVLPSPLRVARGKRRRRGVRGARRVPPAPPPPAQQGRRV